MGPFLERESSGKSVGDFDSVGDVVSDRVPECSLFAYMAGSEKVPLPVIRVYLYRTVERVGQTVDFRLSMERDVKAATAIFRNAIKHHF